jgi:hypothetical protein
MAAAAASSSGSDGGAAIDKEKKIVDELKKISVVVETTTMLPSRSPGRKLLAIYAIIKALRPNTKNRGSVLWVNAKSREPVIAVAPITFKAKNINGQGQPTQGLEAKDLAQALQFAIPRDELRVIVKSKPIIEALRSTVKNSSDDNNTAKINVVALDEFVKVVLADEDIELQMAQTLQLPELVKGAGPLECRVCKSYNNVSTLGSIHDYLAWLQVDKDGEHSDWKHWLREELRRHDDALVPGQAYSQPLGCNENWQNIGTCFG